VATGHAGPVRLVGFADEGHLLESAVLQIARRRGKEKAAVAVAHSILVIAYHLLADQVGYEDLGEDFFARREDSAARTRRLVHQLEQLGHTVTLSPAA